MLDHTDIIIILIEAGRFLYLYKILLFSFSLFFFSSCSLNILRISLNIFEEFNKSSLSWQCHHTAFVQAGLGDDRVCLLWSLYAVKSCDKFIGVIFSSATSALTSYAWLHLVMHMIIHLVVVYVESEALTLFLLAEFAIAITLLIACMPSLLCFGWKSWDSSSKCFVWSIPQWGFFWSFANYNPKHVSYILECDFFVCEHVLLNIFMTYRLHFDVHCLIDRCHFLRNIYTGIPIYSWKHTRAYQQLPAFIFRSLQTLRYQPLLLLIGQDRRRGRKLLLFYFCSKQSKENTKKMDLLIIWLLTL